MTPITAAGMRLSQLSAMVPEDLSDDENEAVTQEQVDLSEQIVESKPRLLSDVVVLLMAAVGEIASNDLYNDGAFGYERADIMVRRVLPFLAGQAGVVLDDVGGAFFLPSAAKQRTALHGTLALATARFHGIDHQTSVERHEDYQHLYQRLAERTRVAAEGRA